LAKLFLKKLQKCGFLPTGGYPQTPLQAKACNTSINPNPFFIRRGFRPLPKPLANLWQGDVTRKVAETATFLRFGIAGHAICFLSAGALYCLASDDFLIINTFELTPRGLGARSPRINNT
jgi:hypothetical protein